jgi:hypothetical protein
MDNLAVSLDMMCVLRRDVISWDTITEVVQLVLIRIESARIGGRVESGAPGASQVWKARWTVKTIRRGGITYALMCDAERTE